MKSKQILRLLSLCIMSYALCMASVSCSKNEEEAGEYDNWQARNQAYVDSIANLAKQGLNGWTRARVYYYSQPYADSHPDNNNIYVYMQKISSGGGIVCPIYSDTVRVQYRGRLIPSKSYPYGNVFGQSFWEDKIEEIHENTAVPTLLAVEENVPGFCQALQNMYEGDVYHIVIPYAVGYGSNSTVSSIPNYSTLIFDTKLVKLYKRGENKTWR